MTPGRTAADTLEAGIAQLRGLGLEGLRARWRSVNGRSAPPHLPQHLLLRLLAYRLQAEAHGDLDKATIRYLEKIAKAGAAHRKANAGEPMPGIALPDAGSVQPGTLFVREWDGVQHRVMALGDGFAWNGTTYRSLSQVARAITGTRWSGPRFFGTVKPQREAGR
jgi:DUF2924 family protein